jgi:vitamin B12 transporter
MPVASIAWDAAKNTTAFCSYSETRRLPSYTELNYESPGSLGNEGLSPEYSQNLEIGISATIADRGPAFGITAFRHETDDTIDWAKPTAETARWQATNIGEVETIGIQGDVTAKWKTLKLYLSYIYLRRDGCRTHRIPHLVSRIGILRLLRITSR